MDLYLKVFDYVKVRDIEIFKRHNAGSTFEELAVLFKLSKQRCQQIHSKIEWKIKMFILLMQKDIKKSHQRLIEDIKTWDT